MEKIIAGALEVATEENIRDMARWMEDAGMCLDFLDDPYTDGTYKTEEEKHRNIVETYLSEIQFIQEFKGEYADEYKTRYDYIVNGGFETDYFASWLEGCSDYPMLNEIKEFCESVECGIILWLAVAENTNINLEAGWVEEGDSYWAYEADNQKWILWSHTEDDEVQIAEVGQDEDGTYYWIEIESTCGYCDFATAEKAMADADNYFDKQAAEAIYQARKNIG